MATTRHLGANTGYTLNKLHLNSYIHTLFSTAKCRVVALAGMPKNKTQQEPKQPKIENL